MPLVFIDTNVSKSDIPTSFLADIANGVGAILEQDTKVIQVIVTPDLLITFDGSTDPTTSARIFSCACVFGPEVNDNYAAKFTELIRSKLGIPKERFCIILSNVPKTEAFFMGSTMATFDKK